MGKRVRVTKPSVPKIRVEKLRYPGELQAKQTGLLLPVMLYIILLLIGFGMHIQQLVLLLLGWLVLGWFFLVALVTARKGKILKDGQRNKVTGSHHADLRLVINKLCRMLDIKRVPDTYIIETHEIGAIVRGIGAPYMVLSSRLLTLLSPRELEAELATLLGHVKAGNVFWRTFVHTLTDGGGLIKLLCAPYTLIAAMMRSYLDLSHCTADTLALVCMDGDYHLLSRTILKILARTSSAITEEQAAQLERFLSKEGVEATAEDVELQYLLGEMQRNVPWLRERLENLTTLREKPVYHEALEAMRERVDQLQLARG